MTLRIIHLEDNPLDGDLVQARLQEAGIDCDLVRVADRESFEAELGRQADLILADYSLPQYNGREALRRAQEVQPRTPFIFVTGALGEERAIDLLKAGGTDYVLKERLGRLVPAVERALREAREQNERRRARDDLRTSEERLRMAQQAAGAGVWDLDLAEEPRTPAPEQYRVWGVDPLASPPTYSALLAMIHEDDREQADREIRSALDCQSSIDVQFRIVHEHHGLRWLHVSARAVCDSSGKPVRIAGIAQDVTENKQSELELKQRALELENLYRLSEAVARAVRLEDIYGIALDSMINALTVDRASILLFDDSEPPRMMFRAWRNLSDWYRSQVEGHSPWTHETRDASPLTINDAATDQGVADYRDIFLKEGIRALAFIPLIYEGELLGKFMLYRNEAHAWSNDEIRRAQNFANHVAFSLHNRRAQHALAESEQRFRALAETVPDIVFVGNVDGSREYVNVRFCELTGLSPDNAKGLGWRSVIHPEDARRVRESWDQAMRSGDTYEITYRVRSNSGTYRWFMDRASAIRDTHGSIAKWFGTSTDIDALIQTEQELAYHAAQLARSNADLEDFAYVASHDLKEPLRGISNYAKFVLDDHGDILPQEGREKLETLVRLSKRMYELLDHLLEYSRVGRADLAIQDVSLEDVVSSSLDALGARLEQEGAEVVVHSPLPRIKCDPLRIGQVISNLVVNAMKYNESPVKRVEIGAVTGGDGSHVIFIKDNGIGIPPQHKENIFRMFKRLHGRDRYGGGTGAGLAIVKKIIHRHNGRIWLESTPGEGTTFFFVVDESRQAPDQPALHAPPEVHTHLLSTRNAGVPGADAQNLASSAQIHATD